MATCLLIAPLCCRHCFHVFFVPRWRAVDDTADLTAGGEGAAVVHWMPPEVNRAVTPWRFEDEMRRAA